MAGQQANTLQRKVASLHADAIDGMDALKFVFPTGRGGEERRIIRSRALVRQCSDAFAALARHGNGFGGASPHEVRLEELNQNEGTRTKEPERRNRNEGTRTQEQEQIYPRI